MKHKTRISLMLTVAAAATFLAIALPPRTEAALQQAPAAAPSSLRAVAALDLTGYWVSIVTEDWRWRMMTAPKGDYRGVPYNSEGRQLAEAWDLAKDNSSGNQCKAYGAAGLMRIPERLHITWDNDSTLKIETDAGRQTRLIHLVKAPTVGGGLVGEALKERPGQLSLQGHSVGMWEWRDTDSPKGGTVIQGGPYVEPKPRMEKGSLKVVTTGLKPGYLRKNGLPYSDSTVLTEYFDRHEDYGSQWFTVTTVVDDPVYLASPFVTTTHFKQESDGAKWSPAACETMPPTASREEQYFRR